MQSRGALQGAGGTGTAKRRGPIHGIGHAMERGHPAAPSADDRPARQDDHCFLTEFRVDLVHASPLRMRIEPYHSQVDLFVLLSGRF
jgi:hypothetical protein